MVLRLMQWALLRFAPGRPLAPASAAAAGSTLSLALALLVPAVFFLYGLDAYPLRDNNEGLYAEIAREMLASGQFLIPHLNGVPYIEKPPLLYWLLSLSMALFGAGAAGARLVSAFPMFALALALFLFCRRHGQARAGCYASIGLASALPVAVISHTVLFDPLLTALLGFSLLSLLQFDISGARRAYRWSMFWLALAVLEKGALALVLVAGIGGLYLLQARVRPRLRALADPIALAILVLGAGWWHLAAALLQDGFSWFYFVNEHLLRFLGKREPRDYHFGPPWFYVPRLLLIMLPWTPFLMLLARRRRAPEPGAQPLLRFARAWTVFPFLFFSLSQAKADYYLLLAAPGLALWLGLETASLIGRAGERLLAACWGVSAASCAVGGWALLGPGWSLMLLSMAWIGLALAGAALFGALRKVRDRHLALLCVVLASAAVLELVLRAAAERALRDSSWQVAQLILQQPGPPPAVYIYRDFEDAFSTLPFYLDRTVGLIDSTSRDLQFGCRSKAGAGHCVTAAEFLRADARRPVVVAVRASRADEFRAMAGAGWRVRAAGPRLLFFRGG